MRREKGGGTIRERRPGVWEVRFSCQGQQESHTVHGNEKAAQKALRRFLVAVEDGTYVPRRQRQVESQRNRERTFRAAAERWLHLAGPDFSPGTVQSYRMFLRTRIYPAIGDVPLAELETTDLDDLYIAMRGELAPKTIRQVHAIISRTLKMAARWGWEHSNPERNVTLPRINRSEVEAPEVADVREIVAKATENGNSELALVFHLAAATGARRGEICALRWGDLDFPTATLTIARALVELEGGGWLEKDTKTHAIRTIRLDPDILTALGRHQTQSADRAGVDWNPNGFIFTFSIDGERPWLPHYLTGCFRKIRTDLGLPKTIRFHSLRHFSASQQLAAGVDVRTVSGRHGWADATMPLNRYGHFIPAADAKAAQVMGELLSGDPKQKGNGHDDNTKP